MKLYSLLSVLAVCAGFAAQNAHAVNCTETSPIASNPDSVYDTATTPGTAIDTRTKLMWQRCSVGQNWHDSNSTCTGNAQGSAQGDGWAWVLQQSVSNKFAGFTDWRVPNIKELRSLVEECRHDPSINDTIFPSTPVDVFYSSSPSKMSLGAASLSWVVGFNKGTLNYAERYTGAFVRLVRGGDSFDNLNPTATVNRNALDFGWQLTNSTSAAQVVTLSNNAASTLTDISISTPAPAEGFSLTTSCGSTLAVGYSCNISVTFSPTADVASHDTINITSNATSGPISVTLTGKGMADSYLLSVDKAGNGTGTVTSVVPDGSINCGSGSGCSSTMTSGTNNVTLTAAPDSGNTFAGWSGACSGMGSCVVSMTQAQSVTATFTSGVLKTLSVTKISSGTVSSNPGGINCGVTTCSADFDSSTSVTLTAHAATGYIFTGWSGACSGMGPCVVSMSAPQNVTATFAFVPLDNYPLSVAKTGSGTVIAGWDIICGTLGTTCSASFSSGTKVTLTAAPDPGSSTFAGWSGDCSGMGSCTVTMTQPQSVTATFVAGASYTLSVAKSGSGTVSSDTGGINCGATCSGSYASSTNVTLSAVAATGYIFTGWSGACSGTGTCVVSMSAQQNVTATFTSSSGGTNLLSVNKAGSGTVISDTGGINCGATCSASYVSSTSVTLTAQAATGYTFTGWSGAGCSGTGNCVVSMSAPQNVTATFTSASVNSYLLSVAKTGSGTVISGWNITCGTLGATCSASFTSGTKATLTAAPDSGNTFAGWSGACSGMGSCVVSMTQAQSVTATFVAGASNYTLSVAKSGSGTVSSDTGGINCGATCSASYVSSTSVTLSAVAATGYTFTGWSSTTGVVCAGVGSCLVSMSQAQNVTATFDLMSAGLYDGIYQWDTGYFLSLHQIGGGALVGTIYWVYEANTEQVGKLAIRQADTFDLFHGQLVGSSATMTGTRFYRACTLSYDFTFNPDSSLTVHLNSVSNSPGVSVADVDCAARYQSVGSFWTIPRIL